MADKQTTRLIVKELVHIKTGKTNKQVEYTIWQVRATKPDGTPIPQNLRTFEELPRNEVIEVTVDTFDSEQYGRSYTLKQVGRKSTRDEISELRKRIEVLEKAVLGGGGPPCAAPVAAPVQQPPPVVPPPAAPPSTPSVGTGDLPPDDIPF